MSPEISTDAAITPGRLALRLTSLRAASVLAGLLIGGFHATYAAAAPRNPWAVDWMDPAGLTSAGSTPWRVEFAPLEAPGRAAPHAMSLAVDAAQDPAGQTPASVRPKAYQYSDAYEVRRKIHVYASVAMIPLFVTQGVLGAKLYDGNFTEAQRTAHQWVGGTILALFGLNTVTGIWNLKEGWGDPHQHKLRVTHGLLMLAADTGFAITTLTAPSPRADFSTHSTHRALAYTSISLATAGYLIMLFGR
jgi:hypothetical protein